MSSFEQLNNNSSVTEQTKMIDEKSLNRLINVSIQSKAPFDIASILYLMYGNDYKYSLNYEWYYFENNFWRKSNDAKMLKNSISNELYQMYVQRMNDNEKILENDNLTNEEIENIEIQNNNIENIITLLKNETFREEIMAECREIFYDTTFLNKIDENPYLIGFKNGVYDLKTGELREGIRNDYVSLCTNINKIDFSKENAQWNELNTFICSIFPTEEKRNYFMTYLSSCLEGINNEQKFRIWIGDGANGKTKLEELFITSFGDYAIKFPITLITGKRIGSNKCTPELVKAKGKRFGYFAEPSSDEFINSGIIKEFISGDKIYGRGFKKDPIMFNPQFKLSLICNNIPNFSKNDEGLWKRLEIIEFISKFRMNPNPEDPNEFMMDTQISEKIKSWKELFMAYLIDVYYTQYRESNGTTMIVPEEIKKYTEEIKLKNII